MQCSGNVYAGDLLTALPQHNLSTKTISHIFGLIDVGVCETRYIVAVVWVDNRSSLEKEPVASIVFGNALEIEETPGSRGFLVDPPRQPTIRLFLQYSLLALPISSVGRG